jgi:hypothetical protein
MDDFTEIPVSPSPVPLTESGQASLADEVLRRLAALPIPPGALCTRSAWVIMISPWGVMTRAVLPIDNRRNRPEPVAMAGLCDLIAMFIERSGLATDDQMALVVLHRPGPARVSDADRYIFRLLCEAAARRDTIRWAFYVVTPPGIQKLERQGEIIASGIRGGPPTGAGGSKLFRPDRELHRCGYCPDGGDH